MKKNINIFLGVIFIWWLSSCAPRAEMNYMKDIDSLVTEQSVRNSSSTIQPGDQLQIAITAEEMDAVAPFNQNLSSNSQSISTGTYVAERATNTNALPTYLVDTDGNINFPVIGKISAAGLTLDEFTTKMTNEMSKYLYSPVVNVRYTNYKVTVLGQVNKPGTYNIPDGQATLLSALGLAGDLTLYGVRSDVLVVRNVNGEITKETVDLTSADFINSPFYYLKQNDVIYVNGNSFVEKRARLDPNTGIYISVASIVVTVLALIFK